MIIERITEIKKLFIKTMDFSKLSQSDLGEFLAKDYSQYDVHRDLTLSQVDQAQQLFTQLQDLPGVSLVIPVIDLYLASIYQGPTDSIYSPEEILNLSSEGVEAFDQFFQFDTTLNDLETNRRRILRILRYLGLVELPEQIFLQSTVLENLCHSLALTDLNTLQLAFDLVELPCKVPVQDLNRQIQQIGPLNVQTYELIETIIRKGSINVLVEASEKGQLGIVRLLLDQRANPNLQKNGRTALMEASEKGHLGVVRLLLDRRADPNLQSQNGWTALMLASGKGHLEIVRILLDRGADPNLQNQYGWTALMLASGKGHLEIVRLLLDRGADPNFQNQYGWTAVIEASAKGHLEIVRLLLDRGADPNLQNRSGSTALMLASEKGHLEVVRLLLDRGADPNFQNRSGSTALTLASQRGHLEIVRLLEQYGAR